MTPVPDAPLLVLFNAGAGRHAEEDAAQPIRAVLEEEAFDGLNASAPDEEFAIAASTAPVEEPGEEA